MSNYRYRDAITASVFLRGRHCSEHINGSPAAEYKQGQQSTTVLLNTYISMIMKCPEIMQRHNIIIAAVIESKEVIKADMAMGSFRNMVNEAAMASPLSVSF